VIVKLINYKPNEDGTTMVKLGKGADRHALEDMSGKEINIDTQQAELPAWEFDRLMPLIRYMDNYFDKLVKAELEKEQAKWQQPEEAA
jgi:hypothetical protein